VSGVSWAFALSVIVGPTGSVSGFIDYQKIRLDKRIWTEGTMTLIEQRYPKLGRLMRLWDSHRQGVALPPASALHPDRLADLAPLTVLLMRERGDDDTLSIASSGAEVDSLYDLALTGAPARDLAPVRGDAEQEARSAIETGRPVRGRDPFGRATATRRPALPPTCQRRRHAGRRAVRHRGGLLTFSARKPRSEWSGAEVGWLSRRCVGTR
jgi:hypothetical protein